MEIITFPTPYLKSNMYLIREGQRGILIDPYENIDFTQKIRDAVTAVDYIILTHEHYDHISGTDVYRDQWNSKVLCGSVCAERIRNSTDNFSRYFEAYVALQTEETVPEELMPKAEYTTFADACFEKEHQFLWQGHSLYLRETPGHSPGSICILLDEKHLFSGDSLLPQKNAMTRFPGGNKRQYQEQTLPFLSTLSPDITVYPGHYDTFCLGEHPDIANKSIE